MSLADLQQRLAQHGQSHLVAFWDELNDSQRSELTKQIEAIDFNQLKNLAEKATKKSDESTVDRATIATAPSKLMRLPETDDDRSQWKAAHEKGEQTLAAGQVGAVLVAGGQGTRLGFPHPKGMFPVGPVSECPLFQVLVEQLIARSRKAAVKIPYFIMTSEATHDETVEFFKTNNYFGLDSANVHFFQQGYMPAVERTATDGVHRVLLADKHRVATSPDGHGGILAAMSKANLLEKMKNDGIEHLYYHQVDNPTAIVCDPAFIGFHVLQNSNLSTKVVQKVNVNEKMGAVVEVDGPNSDHRIQRTDRKHRIADGCGWESRVLGGQHGRSLFSSFVPGRIGRRLEQSAIPPGKEERAVHRRIGRTNGPG